MAPCDAQALIRDLQLQNAALRTMVAALKRTKGHSNNCICADCEALAQPQAKIDPGSPWTIKFCAYEDCDGNPAPGSALCQGHIDDNARIAAEEQQRRAQPQGEQKESAGCNECLSPWPYAHAGDCRIANGMKPGNSK
ncbi:MAG TPA: hypothetical protein VEC57_20875 [Candidatus Limnocylindrales bacterium]|nr:hypothetical protein [Candidatus Limnocylindrales bacterium]